MFFFVILSVSTSIQEFNSSETQIRCSSLPCQGKVHSEGLTNVFTAMFTQRMTNTFLDNYVIRFKRGGEAVLSTRNCCGDELKRTAEDLAVMIGGFTGYAKIEVMWWRRLAFIMH